MKKLNYLICFSLLLMCGASAFANHLSARILFTARLNGANEVPAVNTDGFGVGTFFLNANRDTLCLTVTTAGLSGAITGAHIHTGQAGENGPVLVNFTGNVSGNTIQATLTGASITAELLSAMFTEGLYFNVHTALNPGGEIRGQIKPETDRSYVTFADGSQEVPGVNTEGTALALFKLNSSGSKVDYKVQASGLTGPIMAAHLHLAAEGMNGAVVVNLSANISGNTINGSFVPDDFPGLLEDMEAGNVYLNIHTAEFPNGEIRGQLELDPTLAHDASLNTDEEIPAPIGSDGLGLLWASLSTTLDTLYYVAQVDNLTGPITGAHFHTGTLGNTGPVVVPMTDDVNGNFIGGFVTGAAVTPELINAFLSGGIYANIHTAANPSGEIRGQVYKYLREGYTYQLSGDQEVPEVATAGKGSGIVSIDRDQTNAHFMMVVNDLTGPLAMGHFHNGAAGSNGNVIFTLSDFFDQAEIYDGAFGYWDAASSTPFDAAAAAAFREDLVYVNIHTSANPSGEVRGQVIRNSICSENVLGIYQAPVRRNLTIFPNPSKGQVQIELGDIIAPTQVVLTDISGKTVIAHNLTQNTTSLFTLDISGVAAGMYVLNIRADKAIYTAKLFVE